MGAVKQVQVLFQALSRPSRLIAPIGLETANPALSEPRLAEVSMRQTENYPVYATIAVSFLRRSGRIFHPLL